MSLELDRADKNRDQKTEEKRSKPLRETTHGRQATTDKYRAIKLLFREMTKESRERPSVMNYELLVHAIHKPSASDTSFIWFIL